MPQNVFSSCSPVILGCFLYTDSGLTTPAPDGVYSDGLDVFTVSGGAGEITASALCSNFTTSTTTTTTTAAPILACLGYDASSALLACQDFGNCGTTTTTSTTTTTTTVAFESFSVRTENAVVPTDICTNSTITVYAASGSIFTSATKLYSDSALTTSLIISGANNAFISELLSATIWFYDNGLGEIGANTGNSC